MSRYDDLRRMREERFTGKSEICPVCGGAHRMVSMPGRFPLHKASGLRSRQPDWAAREGPVYFGPLASFTESAPANFCLEAG